MKKIRILITTVVLTFILWGLTTTTVENVKINIEIEQFMSKGIYQENMGSTSERYYMVPRETWQEDKDAFFTINGNNYYGEMGDIIVGRESAIEDVPIVSPVITFFAGGHASFVTSEYSDYTLDIDKYDTIESSVYTYDDTTKYTNRSFWDNNYYRDEVIGLRVDTTDEVRKQAFSHAITTLGDVYNYSFIFNTKNTHYCSDVMSKAYKQAGINLNYDGFATTIHDLIYSNKTYIFLYKKVVDDIEYIYYLD